MDIGKSALELLAGEKKGLELNKIIKSLELEEVVSSRTVRNALNDLVNDGRLERRKLPSGGRGKPPYVYILPSFLPEELRMIEDAPLKVITKTEAELEELDRLEQNRRWQGLTALDTIARGHIQEDRFAEAIVKIAPRIASKCPAKLLTSMAKWVVDDINQLASELIQLQDVIQKNTLAGQIDVRLQMARQYFCDFWSLNIVKNGKKVMNLPQSANDILRSEQTASVNTDIAFQVLSDRIAGDSVIYTWKPDRPAPTSAVGTDASVADIYLQHSTGKFMRPDPVAVMTAAAAQITRKNGSIIGEYQDFDVFPDELKKYEEHQAARNGLIISPAMRNILPEHDFKHSRMAAMELRQYFEDLRVVLGQAKWRPIGELQNLDVSPHTLSLIIRDGRVFPLVHRLRDYEDSGLYGQIVRNQIKQFATVIHHTMSGPEGDIVYGAAVKDPQQSWLAPLVFWFAYTRQDDNDQTLERDDIYKYRFTDTAVSHLLFLGFSKDFVEFSAGHLLVTFRAKRRFSDVAIATEETPKIKTEKGYQPINIDSEEDWKLFISQRIKDANIREKRNILSDEREYNNFIYLCCKVGVSTFYAAPVTAYELLVHDRNGGAGHFLLPRLEVSIRVDDKEHEIFCFEGMLGWLASGGYALDRNHTPTGFDTYETINIPILVPDVVVPAHEAVRFAGKKVGEEVEDALRQLITELRKRQN